MKTFWVEIPEYCIRKVKVKADSKEAAINKVFKGEDILEDFTDDFYVDDTRTIHAVEDKK